MATQTYTISDLAKEFDLTTRAMRFYEDMGLLQPQRTGPGGRNRVYSARDRTRLKLTLRAKRLGLFTIALTGASGGRLRGLADVLIAVPSEETPRIQECHILAGHALCDAVEQACLST